MGIPKTAVTEHYTYGDYLSWPNDERWELIDGIAWDMSPVPNRQHQRIVGLLFRRIGNWLESKPCRVFIAPFDVVLPTWPEQADEDADTVVQPDIVVYCDRSKLTKAGARGAPDWVVEILSPWTSRKDQNEKYRLYERVGVREYWVVDPANASLQIYLLGIDGDLAKPSPAGRQSKAPTALDRFGSPHTLIGQGQANGRVLEGFSISLEELFVED